MPPIIHSHSLQRQVQAPSLISPHPSKEKEEVSTHPAGSQNPPRILPPCTRPILQVDQHCSCGLSCGSASRIEEPVRQVQVSPLHMPPRMLPALAVPYRFLVEKDKKRIVQSRSYADSRISHSVSTTPKAHNSILTYQDFFSGASALDRPLTAV